MAQASHDIPSTFADVQEAGDGCKLAQADNAKRAKPKMRCFMGNPFKNSYAFVYLGSFVM